jgi:hypothetical protein
MPAPDRRAAHVWRLFHDDEARSLQILHEPVRDDPDHYLPAVANLLSAAVAQGEGERLGEVFEAWRVSGRRARACR